MSKCYNFGMYIGVDIGGTQMRVGFFETSSEGELTLLEVKITPVAADFDQGLSELFELIHSFSATSPLQGVGIGVPGSIDTEKGSIRSANNLKGWEGKPLASTASAKFNVPVQVENDAKLATLGEAHAGFGKNLERFVYVIWGTGVGGAAATKHQGKWIVEGCELGQQIVEWNGRECNCGQKGCLEAYIGGLACQKRFGKPLSEITDPAVWEEIVMKAAQGILNISMLHPTPLIVFGGGVISHQAHLLPKIATVLESQQKMYPPSELKLSQLGDEAGMYGGAALFL